jgi:hypothetical protein
MAETQKKSVEEYLVSVCKELDSLWKPMIQIKYLKSETTHYVLVGPDSIYRDSEIFVGYQRNLLESFRETWPGEILVVQGLETIPNTKIIYDNTCTTPGG